MENPKTQDKPEKIVTVLNERERERIRNLEGVLTDEKMERMEE